MLVALLSSEVVSLGFDTPENVKRYEEVVDSLTASMAWGVVIVGEGDTVLLGDFLLGTAPLTFQPDTFPVLITVKGRGGSRVFSIDADTETVVVIYATPPSEEKAEEVKLPPYEEVRDGYAFNLYGKRVIVVKSMRRGWNRIETFTDTATLKYYWPRIDSLVKLVEGKGMVFIGAMSLKIDGVKYPPLTEVVKGVPGGIHKVQARGVIGKVRAYVSLDSADVVVFVLEPSPPHFSLYASRMNPLQQESPYSYGYIGAAVGGGVGCCVGISANAPFVGCLVGSVVGWVLGTLLGSSCM